MQDRDRRDLDPLPPQRWEQLSVPPGWEPIADVCRTLHEGLERSVRDTVETIYEEVALYRDSAVPPEDLVASVTTNLEMLLVGIAEGRGPTSEEIEIRSALGTRRAQQGFPLDALLQAYHVGYRDLWRALLKYADEGDVSHLLLGAATTMWEWTHRVTDGIGRAHAETTRLLAVRAASTRHRFLEVLLSGDMESEEAHTLARTLGFDAQGTFQAFVICGPGAGDARAPRLQAELDALGGIHQAIPHGQRLIVLSQGDQPAGPADVLVGLLPDAFVGAGLVRPGLAGARLSVGDAERVAEVATSPGLHPFDDGWMWAVLSHDGQRLDGLLAQGRRVARDKPTLAETVAAYAANGFSVSAAARTLHIHPNTAIYRLDRWFELTGWDAKSFDGLARSMAALRLPS